MPAFFLAGCIAAFFGTMSVCAQAPGRGITSTPQNELNLKAVPTSLADPQERMKAYLESSGIQFNIPDAPRFFYNERTGLLHVTANARDMARIKAVAAGFNSPDRPPAQVRIEVRIAEITGELQHKIARPIPRPVSVSPWESTRIAEMKAEATAMRESRIFCEVITENAAREWIRELEKNEGVDLRSAPSATTLSGQPASLSMAGIESEQITIPPIHAPGERARQYLRFNAE